MTKARWKQRRFFYQDKTDPVVQVWLDAARLYKGRRIKGGDGYRVMPDKGFARGAQDSAAGTGHRRPIVAR